MSGRDMPLHPSCAGPTPDSETDEAAVRAFLLRHPDFLSRNLDLVVDVAKRSAEESAGPAAISFQSALIDRLRARLDRMREERRALLETAEANEAARQRLDEGILRLISASGFEDLMRTLTEDLPALLDVDGIHVLIGGDAPHRHGGIAIVPPGVMERLGTDLDAHGVALRQGPPDWPEGGAGAVGSHAVVRLRLGHGANPALLLFLSGDSNRFAPSQGTRLLGVLGEVVNRLMRQWLDLPPMP